LTKKKKPLLPTVIVFLQIAITTLMVWIFGVLINAPNRGFDRVFFRQYSRKYSGGGACRAAEFCTFFTVFYCTLAAFASKLLIGIYSPVPMGNGHSGCFWILFLHCL
jgi:ABC-type phosphate transport system permease subunit